jgi:hypothetical protein
MAAELPRRHLTLAATSATDDVGFVSLADLARALPEDGDFRLIGGHMVTLHVHRWGLGADLYRETGDSDLGATPLMLADGAFVARLEALGYHQVAGDRWVRDVADIPAGPGAAAVAAVDLLVPAYQSRARHNVRVGDRITTIEVPGLPDAMNRAPVVVEMRLVRLNGELLDARLLIPDEAAALGLKAFAWADRRADKDAVDLWRCLEVARAARLGPDDLATGRLVEVGAILRHAFDRPDGAALRALLRYRKLVGPAAAQIGTRIAALLDSVCGTS